MDVQEQDPVNDLSGMTGEECSDVRLHFYEFGEDRDSDPSIEVVMYNHICDYLVDTDSVDTLVETYVFVDSDWIQWN